MRPVALIPLFCLAVLADENSDHKKFDSHGTTLQRKIRLCSIHPTKAATEPIVCKPTSAKSTSFDLKLKIEGKLLEKITRAVPIASNRMCNTGEPVSESDAQKTYSKHLRKLLIAECAAAYCESSQNTLGVSCEVAGNHLQISETAVEDMLKNIKGKLACPDEKLLEIGAGSSPFEDLPPPREITSRKLDSVDAKDLQNRLEKNSLQGITTYVIHTTPNCHHCGLLETELKKILPNIPSNKKVEFFTVSNAPGIQSFPQVEKSSPDGTKEEYRSRILQETKDLASSPR